MVRGIWGKGWGAEFWNMGQGGGGLGGIQT